MITIIHGESIEESRNFYFEQRKSLSNLTTLDGSTLDHSVLSNIFGSSNLFFDEKNIAIENFLSKNKTGKDIDDLTEILKSNSKDSNIILWEEKEIGKRLLDKFPNANIQTFKIPKLIFNFLDGIKPNNGKYLVNLFHQLLENSPTEIIIFMLIRQFRIMIGLKTNSSIDEISKMAPWQIGKSKKQADLFDLERLIDLYQKLYKIDSNQKTGKLNLPITSAIDIFLLSI